MTQDILCHTTVATLVFNLEIINNATWKEDTTFKTFVPLRDELYEHVCLRPKSKDSLEKIWNFSRKCEIFSCFGMHFGVSPSIKSIRRYCGEKEEEIIFAELQIISNYSGHREELSGWAWKKYLSTGHSSDALSDAGTTFNFHILTKLCSATNINPFLVKQTFLAAPLNVYILETNVGTSRFMH